MRTSRCPETCKFAVAAMAAALLAPVAAYATSIYVAPNGSPTGLGTIGDPMTFAAALTRAHDDTTVTEVIVRGGVYPVSGNAGVIEAVISGPVLTVRAQTGETPVFDNATQVTSWTADTRPDVYTTTETPNGTDPNTLAYVWETDTPFFYTPLDDADQVAAVPGAAFYDKVQHKVFVHTSDSQPPGSHTIYSSHNEYNVPGLSVWRNNTTIDGLHFQNFVASVVIANYAVDVTIRNCQFDYSYRAVMTSSWQGHARVTVEYCTGNNVAQGPYSEAKLGTTFRHNNFKKTRDKGMIPIDPQDDCGYQIYFNGKDGTIEYNYAEGYRLGALVKSIPGAYVVRHNTFVFCAVGIQSQVVLSTSDVSYNIVARADSFQGITWDSTLTYGDNLYWDVNKTTQQGQNAFLTSGESGTNNLFGDPQFVDPKNGDYRLLQSSPARTDSGVPAGAFGYVTAAEAMAAKPRLRLDLAGWVRPYRPEFSSYDPDFWSAGIQYPDFLVTADPDTPLRLTTTPSFSLGLIAAPTKPVLVFSGWTTNPPATVVVANPSQQSTTVTASTSGAVTANWTQAPQCTNTACAGTCWVDGSYANLGTNAVRTQIGIDCEPGQDGCHTVSCTP